MALFTHIGWKERCLGHNKMFEIDDKINIDKYMQIKLEFRFEILKEQSYYYHEKEKNKDALFRLLTRFNGTYYDTLWTQLPSFIYKCLKHSNQIKNMCKK